MQPAKSGFRIKEIIPFISIALLFFLALIIRLSGNDFGFPYFFHPDEQRLTIPALRIAESGQWDPENFIYPTGFIYLLYFSFKLLSIFNLTFHNCQGDLIILHWLGRFYSALFGAGTVVLIYALGKKAYGSSIGVVSALFLCLNFIHIKNSHYATTDITNLFFVLLSIFYIFELRLPIAGLFGGIATGIKYNAWPIIIPLLIASKKKSIRNTIFFYIIGFFITTPFAFINPRHFLANFIEILITPRSYWLGITHTSPFYYFSGFRPIAGVGIIFILSLLGLLSRLRNWSWYDTIFTTFFLPYIFMVSLTVIKLDRYILIPIVIFIIWAALSLDRLSIILSRLRGRPCFILSMLAVVLSIHPLVNAIRYDRSLEHDTRITAGNWIEKNIPYKTHIAMFSQHPWANPPVRSNDYKVTPIPLVYKNRDRDREIFKLRLSRCKLANSLIKAVFGLEFCPQLFQKRIDNFVSLEKFELFPLRYFQESGVDYIILTGFLKDDLLDKDTARYFPRLTSSARSFFDELEKESKQAYFLPSVKGFGADYALSPSIEIYKLKTNPVMLK